jgi:hypothetical protein
MERLGGLLRDSGEDRSAVDALDRALRILEAVDASAGRGAGTPAAVPAQEGVGGSPVPPEPGTAFEPGPDLAAEPEPGPEPEAPAGPDFAVLRAVADALLDSGDLAGASERLLALAALHRAAGRHDAAMDACLTLLAMTPSDHRLQREIAAIQLDRGWNSVAVEKLHLLARLADLDGDVEARAAIAAFAVERGLEPPPGAVPTG